MTMRHHISRFLAAAGLLAATAIAGAQGNTYDPACSACTREVDGRVYKITGFQFHQPTWCDALGVRYNYNPHTANWEAWDGKRWRPVVPAFDPVTGTAAGWAWEQQPRRQANLRLKGASDGRRAEKTLTPVSE